MNRISVEPIEKAEFYQQMVKQHGSPLLILDCEKLVQQFNTYLKHYPTLSSFTQLKRCLILRPYKPLMH